jgi:two-component system response regulator QseB
VRILILEDDRQLGDALARGLTALGFAVDWFADGGQADAALATTPYDAIVLDLGLPGRDGLHWLGRWRAGAQRLPVLILTARDGVEQRIEGLDAGADDYLVKPIQTSELAARLRAVLRRSQGRPEPVWRHGALEYRPAAKRACWQGVPVELTGRETELLELLLAHPQRVLPRALIQDKLYAFERDIESNALEVHVHHLRRKIHPKIVRTVRGIGYALGGVEDLAAEAPR